MNIIQYISGIEKCSTDLLDKYVLPLEELGKKKRANLSPSISKKIFINIKHRRRAYHFWQCNLDKTLQHL